MLTLRNIILEMIAKGANLKATIDHLCYELELLFPDFICSIAVLDSDGVLRQLSAPNLPETFSEALDNRTIGLDRGSCGSAAILRKPVLVNDIAADSGWADNRDQALALGFQACWSTPIFDEKEQVLGTFAIYHREARGPVPAEQAAIETCVHLCSIAFERHGRVLERERRANVDALTQLANRASFNLALSHLPCSDPSTWALFVLDLDNLKVVNDSFGHHAGDQLLQAAAARTAAAASPNRTFRIGGDEFAILVQSPATLCDLESFARRILGSLCEPIRYNGHVIVPQATIGGAILAAGDRSADSVRQNADYALYHAKETGRGGFVRYWPGLDTRITHRIAAIRDVDSALNEGRIEAHYQPIVRFDTGQIVAMEALCRLRMDNGGLLPAAAFREATADVHIASELTERMLTIVAADMRTWLDMAMPIQHIGINVSLADFHGGRLDQQIAASFKDHGVPLERLVIEIGESTYTAVREENIFRGIEALRSKGLRVALDDFGIGGGLLMPLLMARVDMIKIDKTLVDRLAPENGGAAVIGGLLHTAQQLNIAVVAEGIENGAQATQLSDLGCQLGQGYFFSKPLDKAAATSLLTTAQQRGPSTSVAGAQSR